IEIIPELFCRAGARSRPPWRAGPLRCSGDLPAVWPRAGLVASIFLPRPDAPPVPRLPTYRPSRPGRYAVLGPSGGVGGQPVDRNRGPEIRPPALTFPLATVH